MAHPQCPVCEQDVKYFWDAFLIVNPWKIKCPHCKSVLKSKRYQLFLVLSVITGVGLGGYVAHFGDNLLPDFNESYWPFVGVGFMLFIWLGSLVWSKALFTVVQPCRKVWLL